MANYPEIIPVTPSYLEKCCSCYILSHKIPDDPQITDAENDFDQAVIELISLFYHQSSR